MRDAVELIGAFDLHYVGARPLNLGPHLIQNRG